MSFLTDTVLWLNSLGTFTILLPFFFAFLIFFGLLQKARIWGKTGTNYNTVIAFSLAFLTIYHLQVAEKLSIFIARIGLAFVALVVLMIFAGLIDIRDQYRNMIMKLAVIGYLVFTVVDVFFNSQIIGAWLQKNIGSEVVLTVIITVIVFGFTIGFIMREEKRTNTETKPVPTEKISNDKKDPIKKPVVSRDDIKNSLRSDFSSLSDEDAERLSQLLTRQPPSI